MAMRRLLVLNPNTSSAVTRTVTTELRRIAPPDVEFSEATGRFGARIVSTEAENVIAGHSALALAAEHGPGHDGIILAISFDTALTALRDVVPRPVIGITEAAVHAACGTGRNIGLVAFGESSLPLYRRRIAALGLVPFGWEVVPIASAADYLTPGDRDAQVQGACARLSSKGAGAIVLLGAAIVGTAARLAPTAPVPVFDGAAALAQCLDAMEDHGERDGPGHDLLGPLSGLAPRTAQLIEGRLPWTPD